jgi:hypothetical protein
MDQSILDDFGHNRPGPHRVGRAIVTDSGALEFRPSPTEAGRHALAMLTDDVLDVAVRRTRADQPWLWLGIIQE